MESVHVLLNGYGVYHFVLVDMLGEGELDQHSVNGGVGVEVCDHLKQAVLGYILREFHQLAVHSGEFRGLDLAAYVGPAGRVVSHYDNGQAGLASVLGLQLYNSVPHLLLERKGKGFAVYKLTHNKAKIVIIFRNNVIFALFAKLKIMKLLHRIIALAVVLVSMTSCFKHELAIANVEGVNLMGYWAVIEDSRYEMISNVRAYYQMTDQVNLYYYESKSAAGVPFDGQSMDSGNNFDCIIASGFEINGHDLNLLNGMEAVKFATISITTPNNFVLTFEGDNG